MVKISSPDFRMKPHSVGFICHRNNTATKIKNAFNRSGSKIFAGSPITFDTLQTSDNFECPNVKSWVSTSTPLIGFAAQPAVVDYDVVSIENGKEFFDNNRPVAWIDSESMIFESITGFTADQYDDVYLYFSGVNYGKLANAANANAVKLTGCKIEHVDFYDSKYYIKLALSGNIGFTV